MLPYIFTPQTHACTADTHATTKRKVLGEFNTAILSWRRRGSGGGGGGSSDGGPRGDLRGITAAVSTALCSVLKYSFWGEAVGSVCAVVSALSPDALGDITVATLPILLSLVRDTDRLNQALAPTFSNTTVGSGDGGGGMSSKANCDLLQPNPWLLEAQCSLTSVTAQLVTTLIQGPSPSMEEQLSCGWLDHSLLFHAGSDNFNAIMSTSSEEERQTREVLPPAWRSLDTVMTWRAAGVYISDLTTASPLTRTGSGAGFSRSASDSKEPDSGRARGALGL